VSGCGRGVAPWRCGCGGRGDFDLLYGSGLLRTRSLVRRQRVVRLLILLGPLPTHVHAPSFLGCLLPPQLQLQVKRNKVIKKMTSKLKTTDKKVGDMAAMRANLIQVRAHGRCWPVLAVGCPSVRWTRVRVRAMPSSSSSSSSCCWPATAAVARDCDWPVRLLVDQCVVVDPPPFLRPSVPPSLRPCVVAPRRSTP
jgi:hypothetical protein